MYCIIIVAQSFMFGKMSHDMVEKLISYDMRILTSSRIVFIMEYTKICVFAYKH